MNSRETLCEVANWSQLPQAGRNVELLLTRR